MNLINKKLLQQKLHSFEFPNHEKLANSRLLLEKWVKALKDSDLEGTKEKSVQGKFLSTFLEDILGYSDVTTGNEEWTLIQHPRIENDGKEPDGSLGWFTKDKKTTKAVIELKDAKSLLDKKQNRGSEKLTPIEQAYLYATKYEGCNWIIVSNFKEIRLYNKNRTQEYYEKFDVIDLIQESEFKRFYFLLSKENLISKEKESIIDILAKDTTEAEQDITKKFYSEFREVRLKLLGHLSDNNLGFEKEILLEKTQKLLDRFIFTLFCEDTSTLLPLNLVKNTYERAINSLSPSDERVWTEFKGLFLAIDKGNNRVKPPINAYNGGLFAFDDVLDNLSIKDEFWATIMHLTEYDFETDLNVNILGHIFEQSISDLESLKSELRGEVQDKKKSKRKKDGIFYTPEYITRYIVENTVGKYLEEHPDKLESLKILDPACGSGAFLNQAHSFLVKEYTNRYEALINEKLEKGESITLFDYNPAENNRNILLNNLYGVDLNRESVEITKLAMWLKTARATEPLQNLDKNIKTGNSLIDDPEIAGKKAFNWNVEFQDIVSSGGFDVIIGNPPYVRNELITSEDKKYFSTKYKHTFTGKSDLYVYFFEKYIELLKKDGYGAMIVSSKYTKTKYGKSLIKFLENNTKILEFIDFKDSEVFEGITAYPSIIIFQKTKPDNSSVKVSVLDRNTPAVNDLNLLSDSNTENIPQNELFNYLGSWNGVNSTNLHAFFKKLESQNKRFEEVYESPQVGIKTGLNKAFILESLEGFNKNDPFIRKYILGKDVKRYSNIVSTKYIIFPYKEIESRLALAKEEELSKEILEHLNIYRSQLENRAIIKDGLINGRSRWFEYQQIKLDFDYSNYIIYPDISNGVNFTMAKNALFDMTCFGIPSNNIHLLSILNSKLMHIYLESITVKARGGYLRLKSQYINKIPIPANSNSVSTKIESLVSSLEAVKTKQLLLISSINQFIEGEFGFVFENNILKSINVLGWNEFSELIENKKIVLQIQKKEEFFNWFKTKQSELGKLQEEIESLDNAIDQEVYKLYSLTDEEIDIIEQSI